MLEVIKETTPEHYCVIRTNTYTSNIEFLNSLLAFAQKDFPNLNPRDVSVKCYGGIRYKRTFGIEFRITDQPIPEEYSPIKKLEYIL